jgi:FixJ family two-component response regulator
MPKKQVIAIVDDDELAREGTTDLIRAMGFSAKAFQRAEDFLRTNHLHSTSCLIADIQMPGMTGLELHSRLVECGNAIPTILVTAFPDDIDRVRARQAGVVCYLTKPFKEEDLLACLRSAREAREAREAE